MDTAQSILVIILSSFLAIFLILSIVLAAALIKLVKKMQTVADKAHDIVDNVESAADMFRKTAGPLALGRFFVNVYETVSKHKKKKG
jgi:cell shape-determining protein MreC